MAKPLDGVKILDMTIAYSGPIASMQLADYGAEVIKVEPYKNGDLSRGWLPFVNGKSLLYAAYNRNKKGISLNLKKPEGVKVFLDLVKEADVVMENFRPGTLKKLGIPYEVIAEANPKIIVASISGYGQTGPCAKNPAYSNLAEAMAGTMYSTGFPDMPVGSGVSFGDSVGGMYAALGIMMALYHREKTGQGQYLDIAMTDSLLALSEGKVTVVDITGKNPVRRGNRAETGYPYDVFEASDGYCFLSVTNTQDDWSSFARACELEHLLEDPRFKTNALRIKNNDALFEHINAWTKKHTRAEIEKAIIDEKQAYSPVLSISEVMENEHFHAREMIVDVEDPEIGKYKMPGIPIKMSKTPGRSEHTAAPALGQHTAEVLKSLGYKDDEIQRLIEEEII